MSDSEAASPAETAEDPSVVDVDVTIDTIAADVDGDGAIDLVEQTVTTIVDVDGDGIPDLIQEETTTAYDLDGDGEVDVIESTRVVGADLDGDGELSDDEIESEGFLAVRDDLAAELEAELEEDEADAVDDDE
jgi:hypothetical protein